MKTDRFSDIIRRKLESIRPEFTEKDWARMQSTLQQAGPPQPGPSATGQPFSGGVWTGQPWLLAAATISTVMLIAFSIWQRSEINHLRQTVGQLKQQSVTKPVAPTSTVLDQERPVVSQADGNHQPIQAHESMPSLTQKEELSSRPDTVYVTRYVAIPSPSRPEPAKDRSSQRTETLLEQRYATASRAPVVGGSLSQQNSLNKNLKTNSYGVSSTSLPIDKNASNPSVATTKSPNQPVQNRIKEESDSRSQDTKSTDSYSPPTNSGDSRNNIGSGNNQNNVVAENTTAPTEQAPETSGISANYDLATSRPLSTESINWDALLAQRARRMRPVRTTLVTTQAPESRRIEPIAARFRAGIGGEFDSRMWSAGLFTEIPLGKHLMLGVGLNQATYMGGVFITANDFDNRTHRDFTQEFGRGLDPKLDLNRDILNVDTRMVRVQIPLSLGYRIPLSRTLTLVPAVGTYIALSNTEKVTYYYRQTTIGGFDTANLSRSHPVDLLNGVALSTSLEWQLGRWVVQGSPVVTIPTCVSTQPGPNWQVDTSIGLRARLLYQF